MKKRRLVYASVLTILLCFNITACSQTVQEDASTIREREPTHEEYEIAGEDEKDKEDNPLIGNEEECTKSQPEELEEDIQIVYIEGIPRRIMPQGSLTIEHFIEDLDYMVYVLENNFALLEVAYWAHGICYKDLYTSAREMVGAMNEPCEDMFLAIVKYHFVPLFGTGHFAVFDPFVYHLFRTDFYGGYRGVKARRNYSLMHSPLALRFYEQRESGHMMFWDAFSEVEDSVGVPANNRIREARNPLFNRDEIILQILEEDRIGYIYAGSMAAIWRYQTEIFDFYHEISTFEHLIIDLRSNAGGNVNHFINILLRPHLAETIDAPLAFVFFMDGPYIRRFGDDLFLPTLSSGGLTKTEPYRPASDILAEFDLTEANHPDFERLHYGAPYNRVRPFFCPNTLEDFGGEPAFSGKIWLLTDSAMVSAAQMAAWYAKETGFATLVGDITGGGSGGPRTIAFMPNTGIVFYFDMFYITDSRGRPLEAGTIPHHFNNPGMDALETVLSLIEEGRY